jgi:hypothetical protein
VAVEIGNLIMSRGSVEITRGKLAGEDPLIVIAEVDEAYRVSPDPTLATLRRTLCSVAGVANQVSASAVIRMLATRG